ncbi:hypothetical protein [Rhizobium sp. BK376]|uniref:hypothetical protein n=1 Tax=Rhizobium sp. BK376 TaxID=2512149 RepID=UPI001044C110|nr:hypothetical protein [Rhizobium sp. BK376]TCR80813.1 hypothetical protein EV561_11390 [Rhizobium sp. BK376]
MATEARAIEGRTITAVAALLIGCGLISGCGTVKDRTAPCKRPAGLASFAEDPRLSCGPMRPVNDPKAAFTAIGLTDPDASPDQFPAKY